MPNNDSVRETVMRSLVAVGSEREASFYADIFQNLPPEQFALITIDPRCLKNPLLEALISDLKILSILGLTPILVVGALHTDKSSVRFHTERLCKELENAKIRTTKLNCASYQLMSDVRRKVQAGRFVVLEMTDTDRGLDLKQLAKRLNPAKIIFLQPSGGFRIDGKRVAVVNVDMTSSFPAKDTLSKGQRKFVDMVKDLVGETQQACTYVIVSPLNLLSELFTITGAGTMLRRGARIKCYDSYKELDALVLKQAIETSFGRKLLPEFLSRPITRLYLEENNRGGAIVSELGGLPYLSKFWVAQEAQGEGIAHDIWQALCDKTPVFFWRSRNDNAFNTWYMKMCEGMQVSGDWRVFWIGLEAPEIPDAIRAATNSPQDFEKQ
ncbi:MAG: hypothetical protein L3J65_09720 [Robiginitomaculum sp.]|nr:hypothetical protein [Robiginitomaculum sp.]